LLRFEPDTKEMILVSVHPGVTVNMVLENTAWPLKLAKDLMSTPAPTDTELDILARFDPRGYWTGE
jgi:glutaconate CoA-transferase subunit B